MGAGCAPPALTPMGTIPALEPAAPQTPGPDYLIQDGDDLDVRFPFQPDMNESTPVRPDGRISLAAVGEIDAVGKTASELEQEIIARASAHFRNPQVTVVVSRIGKHYVYVGGEVARPGAVPLVPDMTLLEAVVSAGGFLSTARRDSVLMIIPAPGGTFSTARVNLESVVTGSASDRVRVRANDVVFVPKTWIAGMDDVVRLYVEGLIPGMPSVGIGYPISP
jgi:protein involved in polysaccharide export with SLBB domain